MVTNKPVKMMKYTLEKKRNDVQQRQSSDVVGETLPGWQSALPVTVQVPLLKRIGVAAGTTSDGSASAVRTTSSDDAI